MTSNVDPQALSRMRVAAEQYLAVLERAEAAMLSRDTWLEHAAELGYWSAEQRSALSDMNRGFGIASGREAILLYLLRHVRTSVPATALAGVSGIAEWARRVRELRVEFGWPIESGVTRDDMPYDHYILRDDTPDEDLADRWRVAKTARNLKKADGRPTSGKDRLIHYLREITPRHADKEQLAYVARIQEWPRRLRELEEEGWVIDSNVDDPSLQPGSYRLATLEKRPPRVRKSIKLRHQILDRDRCTCQDCGRKPTDGVALQIHHEVPVHLGGTNDENNLVTLCIQCHGGRHALMGGAPEDELLHPEFRADLRASSNVAHDADSRRHTRTQQDRPGELSVAQGTLRD
ncbi:HNH endonuclease [Streptomyces ginkgonis]|uniref:HNH endonuclease n=1 Tax=Streptomyces ginkgonis TaxID=1812259 RepID=UPI002176E1ED|nr:HNH endonuclease signature motif containing protein [Streptomyces ginkgonis]